MDFESVFAMVGMAQLQLEVEVTRYNLLTFNKIQLERPQELGKS